MMAVGFTARRVGVIGESAARQINACVFKIFLPLLLCFNIVDTQLGASTDVRTLLYAFVTTLLCFGTLFVITPRLCRDRASCGVLIPGALRAAIMPFSGIPLVMMMYPEGDYLHRGAPGGGGGAGVQRAFHHSADDLWR